MQTSLTTTVQKATGLTMDDNQLDELKKLFILSLFKHIGSTAFSRQVAKLLGVTHQVALELRKVLDNDGYILFQLKPFLFYCLKRKVRTKVEAIETAADFRVTVADANLARYMAMPDIRKKLKPLLQYAALSYRSLRGIIDEMPRKVEAHTRNFVYRKMSFIIRNQHYAVDIDDVKQELVDKGLRNLLWTYPKVETLKHAVNIVKSAITKNGINMIHFYTRGQRGIVYRTENGNFQSRVIPITSDTEAVLDTLVCPTVANDMDAAVTTEQMISTRQVIRHFKSRRKRTVVAALMGMNSPKFSAWLASQAKPTHKMPNDDLFESLATRRGMTQYIQYLSQFSGFSQEKVLRVGREAADLIRA